MKRSVAGRDFEGVWLVETVCRCVAGEPPESLCLVANDLISGQNVELSFFDGGGPSGSPPPLDERSVVIACGAVPVVSCFREMEVPPPAYIVDLRVEFRCSTNGRYSGECTRSEMLHYFGGGVGRSVPRMDLERLIQRGGPYANSERGALMRYCRRNLASTLLLFEHLEPSFDGERTLFRGQYLMSVARIERQGVPVDGAGLLALRHHSLRVREALIRDLAGGFPSAFEGGRFRPEVLISWIEGKGVPWPRTRTGLLCTDDDTLKDMAAVYPELEPLRQAKKTLSQLSLGGVPVGGDGRNRCDTRPFTSVTGRNQPRSSEWLLGGPRWLRGFARPEEGRALVLVDYRHQEFGIGAALSEDSTMAADYLSGDPYLALAVAAGAAPPGAAKATHPAVRQKFKTAVVGIMYGIGVESLGCRLGDMATADRLIRHLRRRYRRFWEWQEAVVNRAYEDGFILTPLGWRLAVDNHTKKLTLFNFPMQGTGSDILRLAVCMAHDRGLEICATIHDAILFECDDATAENVAAAASGCMEEAAGVLLGGFQIRTEFRVIRHPDRLLDDKAPGIWSTVQGVLAEFPTIAPEGAGSTT